MCMVCKSDVQVYLHLPVLTVKRYAMSCVCMCVRVRACIILHACGSLQYIA